MTKPSKPSFWSVHSTSACTVYRRYISVRQPSADNSSSLGSKLISSNVPTYDFYLRELLRSELTYLLTYLHSSNDWPVFLLTQSFFTLSFHDMFSILLRQLWWKPSRRFLFASVSGHVSAQYSNMANSSDSHSWILNGSHGHFWHRIPSSLLKAEFALPIHILTSLSQLPVSVIMLTR